MSTRLFLERFSEELFGNKDSDSPLEPIIIRSCETPFE